MKYRTGLPLVLALHMRCGVIAITNLTACFMVERGSSELFYNYDRSRAAVELALRYANEAVMPEGLGLDYVYTDIGSTCSPRNHVLAYGLDLVTKGVRCDVFIGPGCGSAAEVLYDLASFLDVLLIGCPAAGIGASVPISEYEYLARISVTHTNTASTLLRFLRHHNYTSLTVVIDVDNSFFQQMGRVVKSTLTDNDLGELAGTQFIEIPGKTRTGREIRLDLLENANRSRVFILLAPADQVRKYLVSAERLGFTNGDYVYVGIDLFPSVTWGNFTWIRGNIFDELSRKAFNSLLIIALDVERGATYAVFASEVVKLSALKDYYNYSSIDEVDVVTSHFYDSVIFYASLVRNVAGLKDNFRSGQVLARHYRNFTFMSPVNNMVRVDEDGDRVLPYVIKSFDTNAGRFADYLSVNVEGHITPLGQLDWVGTMSELPPNEPFCGFKGDAEHCRTQPAPIAIATGTVFPVLFVVSIMAGAVVAYRRYITAHMDPFWWRLMMHELVIGGARSATSSVPTTTPPSLMSAGNTFKSRMTMKSVNETMEALSHEKLFTPEHSVVKKVTLNGVPVGLYGLPLPLVRVTQAVGRSLAPLRNIQHQNLLKFIGIAVNDENLCEYVVGDYCPKGTLSELLDDHLNLDWNFKCALIKDIAAAMAYIHGTHLASLGNLTSETCRISSNFSVKISDYGLQYFRSSRDLRPPYDHEERDFYQLLWRAPELLRITCPPNGTQKGDTYSFAIIIQQVVLRTPPFCVKDFEGKLVKNILDTKEIVLEVKKGLIPPLRPRVPLSAMAVPEMLDFIDQCWAEGPETRPSFSKVREHLAKLLGKAGDSIVDYLIRSMEQHASHLEAQVEQRMHQFMEQKTRSSNILSQLLPKSIAADLTKGTHVFPEVFPSTTVEFSDVQGFTELIGYAKSPQEVVNFLNTLYSTSDAVLEQYDVYKVETSKDSYMVVSGLPIRNGIQHAAEIASMALALRREVAYMRYPINTAVKLKLRVGINSGPCVAGIIGTKMPRYCLFGDTVNTASRMESHGEAGKIQCSLSTKDLLDRHERYFLVSRGIIDIKGKGPMETFWLSGERKLLENRSSQPDDPTR